MSSISKVIAAATSMAAQFLGASQFIFQEELRQMKTNHWSLLTAICLFTIAANSALAQRFDTP